MNDLYPARVLAFFSTFFGSTPENVNDQSLIKDETIVYEGKTMKLIVPECPLASGSVKIIPTSNTRHFSEWQEHNKREAYELIQHVIQIWEKRGITDYLVYGKESQHSSSIFGWEIVPYPKKGLRFWKQFKVLWNITFGGSCLPLIERQRVAKDFQKEKEIFSEVHVKQIQEIEEVVRGNDAFCNQKVIEKQLVFEGKKIYLLYNYAPLVMGKSKLHFLLVPKQHRTKLTDLTVEEYLESQQVAQKLINFYKRKGYHAAYLFDKNGAEVGQSVPHWHEHLVFTATQIQAFFGKLTIFKNMLIGSSPLPQKELQQRIELLQTELVEVLNH